MSIDRKNDRKKCRFWKGRKSVRETDKQTDRQSETETETLQRN